MLAEFFDNYLVEILATILTAVASFIGVQIKNAYVKHSADKQKKEIIDATVKFVEQTFKKGEKTSEEKKELAKQKALEWLNEKGLSASEIELDILIEACVNGLKNGLKSEK